MMMLFVLLFSAIFLATVTAQTCAVDDSKKRDCGYTGINSQSCEAKGCCWVASSENSQTPWCFYADGVANEGYKLTTMSKTSNGFVGLLKKIGSGNTLYGEDLSALALEVYFETSTTLRVKITDSANIRWEVPQSVLSRTSSSTMPTELQYEFSFTESPFTFEVTRVPDGESVFKLDSSFVFKDQYIELTTAIASSATTFGIGESARLNQALKSGHTYTLWAADIPALAKDENLYGSFPFYLQMLKGSAHGAMLLNSNGMDVTLQDDSLTFKTIGGIVDLYIFTGPTPAKVVEQYTAVVGRPAMMPYWSLGFHNCKYGYTSLAQVKEVVANYSAAGIPLDTQWMDIDYMQDYRDFTTDAKQFPQAEVSSFVKDLHSKGMHFVPIIDPGIMVYSGYEAYEKGLSQDLFIKDLKGDNYLGQVWPGPTHFPDFLHPKSQAYWTDQIQSFYDMVPVDGLWIDMNEVSNFCNVDGKGQACRNTAEAGCPASGASQTNCCLVCSTVDSSNKYDFPPYAIRNMYGLPSQRTVAMSATHYGNVTVYDAHNLYGLTEQIATASALETVRGKRAFVLSRSSFLSTGKHSAKWTGDNGATWDDLKSSIISVMDFNIFGVPMVGADICGFILNTTEELCSRWIEVGAFYPFSRNHNDKGHAPQELYLWPNVAAAAKSALAMRYQLLPFLYTLFSQAHFDGATVARPLWMNFPEDSNTVSIDRQFMLGSAVLVSPVLDQGATSVSAYFPKGLWYSFSSRSLAIDATAAGKTVSLDTPLTQTNVHVKGGSVLPLQEAAMTTTEGRSSPFTLLVALCPGGMAFGDLFWDDGEQVEISKYLSVQFKAQTSGASAGALMATVSENSYEGAAPQRVQTVTVMGSGLQAPSALFVDGQAVPSSQLSFDAAKGSITFSSLNLKLTASFELAWK